MCRIGTDLDAISIMESVGANSQQQLTKISLQSNKVIQLSLLPSKLVETLAAVPAIQKLAPELWLTDESSLPLPEFDPAAKKSTNSK